MKRSGHIKLLLIGGLSSGALGGCSPGNPPVSADTVYTNNYYVPGAGYYHAPFCDFYPLPYNHYEASTRQFYFGGQWASTPFASVTNISSPTPAAASRAEVVRTDIPRGGFGGTGGGYFGSSSGFHSFGG